MSGETSTSVLESAIYGAFRDMGSAEGKSLKVAVLERRAGDLTAAVTIFELDIASVETDQVLTKGMVGSPLAFNVANIFELFSH